MKIYLFDTIEAHTNLLPLSFTRPLADFRCGILTIREKWEKRISGEYGYYPVDYLREKFGTVSDPGEEALYIAGNLLPDEDLLERVNNLPSGEKIIIEGKIVVFKGSLNSLEAQLDETSHHEKGKGGAPFNPDNIIKYVFDIFLKNGDQIKKDYVLITKGRKSAPLPECVRMVKNSTFSLGKDDEQYPDVFIEEGAVVECATINTVKGPVYIGKDAVLMEEACVRGPFALCEESEVRMGAKIYESTTIGPHCKVGGEINNTVFFGYSNRAHEGYLGNAVIGEWCNIGAGTNASNLKNDYSKIRLWNYATRSFMRTDLQFCGLIMGDHSKIGVNCMINTATVIGVGVNIHGAGFPRTFVPCFCEGSPVSGFSQVSLQKFIEIAQRVMARRNHELGDADETIYRHIYDEALEW